jgi:eukaryotic-like serine/threonine-protein kinase
MSADGVGVGDVLAGKYRVERVLGQGGMGVVVAATHLALDQLVALKFMLPQAASSADAVARFLREARAAVRLRSQHVGKVLDVGTLETGAPYIVMEYLDGIDLGALLQQRGRLPVEEAVGYLLQAIDALAEAHTAGIVHRDLKPANLFVTRQNDGSPLVKVLDFGISKMQLGTEGLTATTAIMGSPAYMSPEQLRASRDADARSDIWSLGVILYQLVSGMVPYSADTMPELCVKILTDPLPPLSHAALGVPASFTAVVERCLEKDRQRRFNNVAELALALEPFADLRNRGLASRAASVMGVRAVPAPPPAVAAAATLPPQSVSTSELVKSGITMAPSTPSSPRRRLVALGAGALVVAVVVVAVLASGRRAAAPVAAPVAAPAAPAPAMVEPTPAPAPAATPPPPAPAPVASVDAGLPAPAPPAVTAEAKPARKKPSSTRAKSTTPAAAGAAPAKPAPAPEDDPMDSRK